MKVVVQTYIDVETRTFYNEDGDQVAIVCRPIGTPLEEWKRAIAEVVPYTPKDKLRDELAELGQEFLIRFLFANGASIPAVVKTKIDEIKAKYPNVNP